MPFPPQPTPPVDWSDPSSRTSHLLVCLNRLLTHSLHHVHLRTPLHIPPGPLILASNHTSSLDPLILQSAFKRPIRWMMAAEYFDLPGLGWFFKALRVIPVERNGKDSSATRAALRSLAHGDILGIFPEGRIETTRAFLPLNPGLGKIAAHANVPILPAYISGTQRLQTTLAAVISPNDAHLSFGSVIPSSPNATQIIAEIERQWHLLKACG